MEFTSKKAPSVSVSSTGVPLLDISLSPIPKVLRSGTLRGEKSSTNISRVVVVWIARPDPIWKKSIVSYFSPWGSPWINQIRAFCNENSGASQFGHFYMVLRPIQQAGRRVDAHIDQLSGQDTETTRREPAAAAQSLLRPDQVEFVAGLTLCSNKGVGILGNVWTQDGFRRQGAMRMLLQSTLDHFEDIGGRAMFLGTGFGNIAFRLYEKFGFQPVEPESGYMVRYFKSNFCPQCLAQVEATMRQNHAKGLYELVDIEKETFQKMYFGSKDGDDGGGGDLWQNVCSTLTWADYPLLPTLFVCREIPGVVRCCPLNLMGLISSELPLIDVLLNETSRNRAAVLRRVRVKKGSDCSAIDGAVVGFSYWTWEPRMDTAPFANTAIVDTYCHQYHWGARSSQVGVKKPNPARFRFAQLLFDNIGLPKSAKRIMLLADSEGRDKLAFFEANGFRQRVLERNLAKDAAKTTFVKMLYLERLAPNLEKALTAYKNSKQLELDQARKPEKVKDFATSGKVISRGEQHNFEWSSLNIPTMNVLRESMKECSITLTPQLANTLQDIEKQYYAKAKKIEEAYLAKVAKIQAEFEELEESLEAKEGRGSIVKPTGSTSRSGE